MRKTVVYCDKCGAEIMGIPIQIIPEHSDLYGDCKEPYLEDVEESELPPWIERMLDKEFCEDCAKEIFDFALNNADANEKEPDLQGREPGSGEAIRKVIRKYGIPIRCNALSVNPSNNLSGDI